MAVHAKSLHYTFDQKVPPVTILHNLADGHRKADLHRRPHSPFGLEWTPDSSGFYAWAPFSNDPKFLTASITLLYFYDVASGKSVPVPLDWENGIGSDLAATRDGFVVGLAGGAHFEIARYIREKSGDSWTWKRRPLEGDQVKNIQAFEVGEDGKTFVYSYSTASKMPQLYQRTADGDKLVGAGAAHQTE